MKNIFYTTEVRKLGDNYYILIPLDLENDFIDSDVVTFTVNKNNFFTVKVFDKLKEI